MIERELISLLGYTAVVSVLIWLTSHFWGELWDEDGATNLGGAALVAWGAYLLCFGLSGGLPIQLWIDYLEAHGVVYTSGALK